jgi:zinc transporter, ZIP family
MGEAFVFGAIASSALVLGALAGVRIRLPKRVLAAMLSFAAGALITALTFEMFEDSYEKGGIWRAALGLAVGAIVFTVVSYGLDRMAEGHRTDDQGSEKLDTDAAAVDAPASAASVTGAAGLALLAAATLDGVPESLVLGVSLSEGSGGLALLVAIFVANFPEALVGSASMRAQGRSALFILGSWTLCAVLLVFAVVLGAGPLAVATPETLSLPLAFAAGAVLAALADTIMPEAYEQGGPTVALSTAAGFVLSFVLSTV